MIHLVMALLVSEPAASPTYETLVQTTGSKTSADALPFATTVLDQSRIRNGRQESTLAESLVAVPGVMAINRDNFAQDLRLSIRGFGARSSFGVRGITIFVDGIPQSLADGQAQVDGIDPSIIGRMEILRGPAGALYGNAAGGVIRIDSYVYDGPLEAKARAIIGQYGSLKLVGVTSGMVDRTAVHASVTHFATDGYRAHARAETTNARVKVMQPLSDATKVTLTLAYTNAPRGDDAGGLTGAESHANPRQAAPQALQYNTGEALEEVQLGTQLATALTDTQRLQVSAFYLRRNFSSNVPARTVDFGRDYVGVSGHYVWNPLLAGLAHTLGVGVDVRDQHDTRENDTNVGGHAVLPVVLNQDENVRSIGAYIHGLARLGEALSLLASARHDDVRFSVDNLLNEATSGGRTLQATTFLGGASLALAETHALYANIAQAFQTPTTTELVQVGGGFNRSLNPERAVSTEVGARGRAYGLRYEVAAYYIRLHDELVPFEDANHQTFYRNAGRSRRWGAEASLAARPLTGLDINVAATLLDARFTTYTPNGVSYAGNRVPGIEPLRFGAQVQYTMPWGTFVGSDAQYAGHMFADDANTVTNHSALIIDVRAGQRRSFGPCDGELFVGAHNLFADRYDDNIRLNATAGRYFEPAAGRTWYAGAALGYRL